jgi:hypothetical protein
MHSSTEPKAAGSAPSSLAEKLGTAVNPALARVAQAVQSRDEAGGAENYSRMHHRHNRD